MPQEPLFQIAPPPYLIAQRTHSSMPGSGAFTAPSLLLVYGREPTILGLAGIVTPERLV
jgi:hypothetical protein